MAFNELIVNGFGESSPTLNGVGIGSTASGSTFLVGRAKTGTVSATVALNAATALITLTPIWEVSADGATWTRAALANGAAYVAQASAGTTNTRVVSAPDAVYSQRYARVSILVGGAAGLAPDTATVGYNYIEDDLV